MIERTLIIIKPDGVQRNLVDKIIERFEAASLKVIKKKKLTADKKLISEHYPNSMAEAIGEKSIKAGEKVDPVKHGLKVVKWLRDYLTSGTVIAMILEGEDAIRKARDVTGYTDPSKAEKGTIRGDFGDDSILQANKEKRPVRNLIHASDSKENAEREIKLWFGK